MAQTTATSPRTKPADRAPASVLLACGAAAGPLYVVVGAVEAATRNGFDMRHQELSLAANGRFGWVQVANFLVSGLLTVLGAFGLRRVLQTGPGSTWMPRLVGVFGAGVALAGIFRADPAYGFPLGTPQGRPAHVSWHGNLHFLAAGIGFVALVVACFVLARRFAAAHETGWAGFSRVTGVLFVAAFAGVASGSNNTPINLAFTVAVVLGWTWVSAVCVRLRP